MQFKQDEKFLSYCYLLLTTALVLQLIFLAQVAYCKGQRGNDRKENFADNSDQSNISIAGDDNQPIASQEIGIDYFTTTKLRFRLYANCSQDLFGLVQKDLARNISVDWTKKNGTAWYHATTYDLFTLSGVTLNEGGDYYATCGYDHYIPYPLHVTIHVNPMIMDVHIKDDFNKSSVISRENKTLPHVMYYNLSVYLFENRVTTLTLDLGLGKAVNYKGEDEYGTFTLSGLDDSIGRIVEKPLKYPNFPDGERRAFNLTISETSGGSCYQDVNAVISLKSWEKLSIYNAYLRVNFMHVPTNLTFGVGYANSGSSEFCLLNCTRVAACPDVTKFSMAIRDQNNRTMLSAESNNQNYVEMKLPFLNCEWLANNRNNFHVICEARNEVGTKRGFLQLSDLDYLEQFEKKPIYTGVTVAEGFLITVCILLLISILFNVYAYRKRYFSDSASTGSQDEDEEEEDAEQGGEGRSETMSDDAPPAQAPSTKNGNKRVPSLRTYVQDDDFSNYVEPVTATQRQRSSVFDDGECYSEAKTFSDSVSGQPQEHVETAIDSGAPDYSNPHYVDPTNNRFSEQRSKDF